mmetsp:Transcript_19522/g.36498  ORF Transcript_19522/g.36498 Transcript_19522/m.36498 type:complete len:173 (-) Transcript_19522:256-774(-)
MEPLTPSSAESQYSSVSSSSLYVRSLSKVSRLYNGEAPEEEDGRRRWDSSPLIAFPPPFSSPFPTGIILSTIIILFCSTSNSLSRRHEYYFLLLRFQWVNSSCHCLSNAVPLNPQRPSLNSISLSPLLSADSLHLKWRDNEKEILSTCGVGRWMRRWKYQSCGSKYHIFYAG